MISRCFSINKYIVLVVLLVIVLSCSSEEDNIQQQINVESISGANINEGGVMLSGRFENINQEVNFGFVLSAYKNTTYQKQGEVIIKKGVTAGEHQVEIRKGLKEGQKYYFNCFVQHNGEEIFGKERVFVSNGSALPEVKDFFPKKARLSDTIVIKGAFFSNKPKVLFSNIEGTIITATDSLIKVRVPYPNGSYEIRDPYTFIKIVNDDEQEKVLEDFSLLIPKIDSIFPKYITDSDTLKIYGSNFDRRTFENMVTTRFEGVDYNYKILELRDNFIKVEPREIYIKNPKIVVRSQLSKVEKTVEVLMPTITSITTSCISFEDSLVINGANFPVNNGSSYTKLNEKYIFSQEKTKTKLVFKLGEYFEFKDFKDNEFSINYLGNEILTTEKVCVNEPWIRVKEAYYHRNSSKPHLYQGNYYAITSSYYNGDLFYKMAKFNNETKAFDEIEGSVPPDEKYLYNSGALYTFHSSKLYVKHYITANVNGFFSYDIFTNERIELAGFPGELREYGFMITVGDYIYTGLGIKYPNIPKKDIWRYSILDNTWEKIVDEFPGIISHETAKKRPFVFLVNSKIYLGSGQFNPKLDLWELDTQSNQVIQKSDMPAELGNISLVSQQIFELNNKAYFQYKSIYEYSPNLDSWRVLNSNNEIYSGENSYYLLGDEVFMLYNGYVFKLNSDYIN
ncbi:hypothetical protein PG911_02455 [Tenacibaculum ovolyticum]|uniref:hypothetical protein n=1 Tax=Tenacibaculum ovolyticum TaxID=104270 RepID=UPI0022F3AC8A|nr:hypothetical protein [Tenacibaculum ovolyticum]WBX77141.1 hypothetical protein PG911_02455 [Tenacibaculum ovolyticum]